MALVGSSASSFEIMGIAYIAISVAYTGILGRCESQLPHFHVGLSHHVDNADGFSQTYTWLGLNELPLPRVARGCVSANLRQDRSFLNSLIRFLNWRNKYVTFVSSLTVYHNCKARSVL